MPMDWLPTRMQAAWSERQAFAHIWDSLNGKGSWAVNPWCWCVSYRSITP
jgi:hypothetical protein